MKKEKDALAEAKRAEKRSNFALKFSIACFVFNILLLILANLDIIYSWFT